ncbi:sugar transferase [Segatella salivae]|uniref:sugar transferase n=1 Tax=Segatella salivae TaxID=228604 RepID=UPI001CB0671A|nr:sugar transferase [Segatella salivae]MBF1559638.1 sugar transferase [Segatella salivae]
MTILDNGYIVDGMNTFECEIKRLIDMFVASFCIVFFAPLFVFCYVAIKREDGGPAIFKQERIGRFGRPFTIYKFRSMTIEAETNGPVLSNHSQDKRLTKIGRFLRLRHLDELPQLWNVIKGDMAFVGPRPERQFYIEKIMKKDPRYCYLYQIRPGVTSYATLYNGYTDTIEKMLVRLNMDLYYLEHRSLWLDFRILSLTFLRICFGKKF